MVLGEHLSLDLEEVRRVAHVRQQVRRNGRPLLDDAGECVPPRLEHRILRAPLIQGDGTGVGVHHRLDRVADVVDRPGRLARDAPVRRLAGAGGRGHAQPLGVRVLAGGGVAVHHPVDVAIGHDRVRGAVQGEERRDLGDPGQRLAIVEDLRIAVDGAGQQDVELAELDRVEDPGQRGAHRHAAAALVGGVLLPAGVREGVVEFLAARPALRPADDDVVALRRAEVHPRLEAAKQAPRRQVALHVVGGATAGHGVLPGGHEPEAVRVHQMGVDPVALPWRWPGQAADRDRKVLRHAVTGQRVPVHRQRAGELVEPLDLL